MGRQNTFFLTSCYLSTLTSMNIIHLYSQLDVSSIGGIFCMPRQSSPQA
jgi:hypothetical protein